MEKRSIKDLIQTFIVDSTITKDIVLSKLKLGGKTKLAGLEDYDFKSIIINMHNNNFNYFYQCLSIWLKEKDIILVKASHGIALDKVVEFLK